ncbi:MAG: hypothetical protein M3R02_20315 [Chloroflexota bacterium]|nr:hypothetical protein [Chloroflexota bacterium]
MSDRPSAGRTESGYVPSGEAQGQGERFSAAQVATAFGVEAERVHRALAGEFSLPPEASVDSRQAQQLAEVLIGDLPLDRQEAALMQLGAFTPRRDQAWSMGETPPGEESDRFAASADVLEDEVASKRGSNDPAYPTG